MADRSNRGARPARHSVVDSWTRSSNRPPISKRFNVSESARIAVVLDEAPIGSIAVALRRSPIGSNWRKRRILRSLNLSHINSVRVGPDEPWFTGQIAKIHELVEVKELRSAHVSRKGPYHYELLGLPGEITKLASGEYLQVEAHRDSISVVWSSAAPLVKVIGPLAQRTAAIVEWDDVDGSDKPHREDLAAFLERVKAGDSAIGYAQVKMANYVLAWTRDLPKFEDEKDVYSEVSVTYPLDAADKASAEPIIEKTATPRVRALAHSILANSDVLSR